MTPPETPQEYIEYFQWLALHADPPATKWAVGLQAAQLWNTYHEQVTVDTETLIELIHILMPYRFAGSGFHGLWTTVLYHLRTFPVNQQVTIWRAIFDPTNHGERLLQHPERAEAICSIGTTSHSNRKILRSTQAPSTRWSRPSAPI